MYHRRIFRGFLALAIQASFAAGCGDDVSGPDEFVDDIPITIEPGPRPVYSWQGGPIMRLTVSRAATPNTIVWGVETADTNGIPSPVVHGIGPIDTTIADTTAADTSVTFTVIATGEDTLRDDIEYRVTVRRADGVFGRRPFIP